MENNNNEIEMLFDDEQPTVNSTNVTPVVKEIEPAPPIGTVEPAVIPVQGGYPVVTENVVPQNVETIAVDDNGQVKPISIDYNEYRNSLNQLYSLSTADNSIISTFSVDNSKCTNTVTLKTSTTEEVKKQGEFEYNNDFIENFLVPVVTDYNNYNQIFSSNIEILDEDKANFIVRTNKNDSLIIMGIDMAVANRFKDLVTVKENNVEVIDSRTNINQKGISNFLVIILTIFAIGMTLVGTIFFTIMANR